MQRSCRELGDRADTQQGQKGQGLLLTRHWAQSCLLNGFLPGQTPAKARSPWNEGDAPIGKRGKCSTCVDLGKGELWVNRQQGQPQKLFWVITEVL